MDRPSWVEAAIQTDGVNFLDQDLGITYDAQIESRIGKVIFWILRKIGVFV
jgi:hypothetical protein